MTYIGELTLLAVIDVWDRDLTLGHVVVVIDVITQQALFCRHGRMTPCVSHVNERDDVNGDQQFISKAKAAAVLLSVISKDNHSLNQNSVQFIYILSILAKIKMIDFLKCLILQI